MNRIAATGKSFRTWLANHRVELRLCFRVTISAVLSLAASHLLNLPVALWAVLTAVVLTQLSVGRSLKATTDYLIGTLGGAIYAGAVGAIFPYADEVSLLAGLAIAVAPTVLLAGINPRFSAAPFTAVMVFLAPTIIHAGPIASAVERLIEVAVGGVIGLLVSLVVFPARAHDLAIEAAAQMLDLMARFAPELCAKFTRYRNETSLSHVQNSIGEAFVRLDAIALEARHERMTRLAAEPDQGPLLRTLLRLRHDLVMIGRAAIVPLPEAVQARLGPRLARVGETAAHYLHGCAAALLAREGPPPSSPPCATRVLREACPTMPWSRSLRWRLRSTNCAGTSTISRAAWPNCRHRAPAPSRMFLQARTNRRTSTKTWSLHSAFSAADARCRDSCPAVIRQNVGLCTRPA
jgi:uncharacterized membrane protein YccC